MDLTLPLTSLKKAKSILDKIDEKLLDTSIFGLFKSKNYQSYAEDLTAICNIVIPIHDELKKYDTNSIVVKTFLNSSIAYAYALNLSSMSLLTLSMSLQAKANNGNYSITQYQADLSDYTETRELVIEAEKKMIGDYHLFDLNIIAIDCSESIFLRSQIKKVITCRKCKQKIRVANETGTVECPSCFHKWLHEAE